MHSLALRARKMGMHSLALRARKMGMHPLALRARMGRRPRMPESVGALALVRRIAVLA
jgi:hypothetical protein